jgi:uncharacterized Fe-S cluster-containing radical SAM superfamily protein
MPIQIPRSLLTTAEQWAKVATIVAVFRGAGHNDSAGRELSVVHGATHPWLRVFLSRCAASTEVTIPAWGKEMKRQILEDQMAKYGASIIKSLVGNGLLLRSKLNDTAFYCNALQGESDYNICINSDLTVSCNCSDKEGEGIIGDLKEQGLPEILSGEKAHRLRAGLARGRLPIKHCAACSDLRIAPRNEAMSYVDSYKLPVKGIMLENNTVCNLECIGCRDVWTMRRSKRRMSLEDVRVAANALKECSIREVHFFNLGEPFLCRDIREQIRLLTEINPGIRINCSTNGTLLDTEDKRDAALLMKHLTFSIHGASQESVARYQRGGDFARAYQNMKSLVEYKNSKNSLYPSITWQYVLFNWNDSEPLILRAVDLAKEAKVNTLVFVRAVTPFFGISWRSFLGKPFGRMSSSRVSRWYERFSVDLS